MMHRLTKVPQTDHHLLADLGVSTPISWHVHRHQHVSELRWKSHSSCLQRQTPLISLRIRCRVGACVDGPPDAREKMTDGRIDCDHVSGLVDAAP